MTFTDLKGKQWRIKETFKIKDYPGKKGDGESPFVGMDYCFQDVELESEKGNAYSLRICVAPSIRIGWGGGQNKISLFEQVRPLLVEISILKLRVCLVHCFLFETSGLREAWLDPVSEKWKSEDIDTAFAAKRDQYLPDMVSLLKAKLDKSK